MNRFKNMANEELNQQRLNQARAQQTAQEDTQKQTAQFPWLMFCFAIVFDLIGLIPIVNIFSEIFAGLVLWLWKKEYLPKSDPLIDIVAIKIFDFILGGLLPSNIGTVVITYIRKKAESKLKSKIGGKIITKFAVK